MFRLLYWLLGGWKTEGEGDSATLLIVDELARVRAYAREKARASSNDLTVSAYNDIADFCDAEEIRILNGEPA